MAIFFCLKAIKKQQLIQHMSGYLFKDIKDILSMFFLYALRTIGANILKGASITVAFGQHHVFDCQLPSPVCLAHRPEPSSIARQKQHSNSARVDWLIGLCW